jgi:hypothetical protein
MVAARHALLAALLSTACASPAAGKRPPFDAERAFADLETQVGFGPRVPGSEGHARTRAWLVETLTAQGAKVEEDAFQAAGLDLHNIVARFRPEAAARVMLFAHWDTRPVADMDPDPARRAQPVPGANDGASGVAVLLELGRMFAAAPPPVGVDLVLLDGEDQGEFRPPYDGVLLGSKRFAKVYRGPRPRLGILLDMVGDRQLAIPREELSRACCPRTVEKIWQAAKDLGHGGVFVDEDGAAVIDDHVPLNRAGLGVVDLIDFSYPAWHTTSDLPEATSAASLRAVGEVVAEVVYREKP